jgi:hypothetical protein
MSRKLLSGVLMAATALATQPALAQEAAGLDEMSPFGADVYPMSTGELEAERGGLLTPFGEINFGAVMRTIIDGQVALETQLIWTPNGPVQSVVSNIGAVVQNAQSGLNFTPDAGVTNGMLQATGNPAVQDVPGMDLTKDSLDSGLNPAVDKTTQVTQTGGDALGLAGQLVPPNNPTLDTIVDAALDLTGPDLPKAPTPPAIPGGGGGAPTGAVDVATGVLGLDATGAPGGVVQQVTQATPPTIDDPIGDLVVASTTTGQTSQQVVQAAAALGIDLGAVTGGNALVLAGENGGGTAILHNISETGLSNVLLNTASGQDIRIETDITLVMPGLEAFQQDILSQNLQLDLFDAIGNALTSGLP